VGGGMEVSGVRWRRGGVYGVLRGLLVKKFVEADAEMRVCIFTSRSQRNRF
jgi:hypothetical protein